jgi:glycylpeptide N-tetradecanoyltransferase
LPEGFEWSNLDLSSETDLNELYDLLKNHYVEDSEGKFRFDYSHAFLKWALSPPGGKSDWLVGVRAPGSPKLFGFISAIPVSMRVNKVEIQMAEVNFLCVHKKLREKRLAPMLIKEVTRRVNLQNIWQAIYTSGTTLPTPYGTAQYHHRNLNPKKLVDVKFSFKPANQTMS